MTVSQTADNVLSTGIIIAIVVPCAIVGIAIFICLIICIYCVCCRKSKTSPGMVLQPQAPQIGGYNNQLGGYNNQFGGFNNQPGGFNNQPGGFNNQPGGFNNQPGGFNNQSGFMA